MRFPWSRPYPDVEERLAKLERAVRDLVLDWDQTYEKFRLLSLRLSKRDKREEEVARAVPDVNQQILWEREGSDGLRAR